MVAGRTPASCHRRGTPPPTTSGGDWPKDAESVCLMVANWGLRRDSFIASAGAELLERKSGCSEVHARHLVPVLRGRDTPASRILSIRHRTERSCSSNSSHAFESSSLHPRGLPRYAERGFSVEIQFALTLKIVSQFRSRWTRLTMVNTARTRNRSLTRFGHSTHKHFESGLNDGSSRLPQATESTSKSGTAINCIPLALPAI